MTYAPILFVSALTTRRVDLILPKVIEVSEAYSYRVKTSVLNDVIYDAIAINPPPTVKGKKIKINYATQVSVKPPTFVVFVNEPELVHFSYKRFLDNRIRDAFDFTGTPIHIILRKKNEEDK